MPTRGPRSSRPCKRPASTRNWARLLPGRLASTGVTGVKAEVDVQLFCGDPPAARFWSLTWLQARERLIGAGIEGDLIDRGRAVLDDPARWFYGPASWSERWNLQAQAEDSTAR